MTDSFAPRIIVPRPEARIEFYRELGELYHEWRTARDATEPKFVVENIRFTHDPEWSTRWFSMQRHHDNPVVWKVVVGAYILTTLAAVAL